VTGERSFKAAFNEGLRQGEDPVNTVLEDGRAVTTWRSRWIGTYCERCHHRFREDDPVWLTIGADGKVARAVHDDRLVSWCGERRDDAAAEPASDLGRVFFEAIDAEAPPRVGHVRRLLPGDPLLELRDMVRPKDRRHCCFVCRETFRPYEFVVVCVCSPGAPQCSLAVHRDPAHNLLCFEEFLAGQSLLRQCPMDMRPLDGS
jgi:hypothetical protein